MVRPLVNQAQCLNSSGILRMKFFSVGGAIFVEFTAKIYVTLKEAVNDPQGVTVLQGLKRLGFEISYQ